jgi:2-C-methyl-D-erythritol 2,4-cyclodiphosphate synthase
MTDLRFGIGFDVHPREGAGTLWLGGIRWEGEPRLAGHSDGDVVCHALADALLGAAALGDVGEHFSESDPSTAGIGGGDLLRRTAGVLGRAGFRPHQCDVVVIADRPRVASRRDDIRAALAGAVGIGAERVSVKASRPEGLGLSGDGAACLALAVVAPRA